MRRFALLLPFLFACPVFADTIDFTVMNLDPTKSVQFGALTISSIGAGPPLAIVEGVGLGLAGGHGSDGSIDYGYGRHYDSNNYYLATLSGDGGLLDIIVDGYINSFTLAAYMIFDEGPVPVDPAAVFVYHFAAIPPPGRSGGDRYGGYSYGASPTIVRDFPCSDEFPNCQPVEIQQLGLIPEVFFNNFLNTYEIPNNFPDYQVRYGFSLTSIDFTPNTPTIQDAPEPSSIALLGVGLLVISLIKKRAHSS
jgi:hypothetical protein